MTDITTENYADVNARAIDGWNAQGWEWGTPLSHEEYLKAEQGRIAAHAAVPHQARSARMVSEPTYPACAYWGSPSGGGLQMPIFAALGARCTVFDYTPSQLESERMVSRREKYFYGSISVRGDISKPLPFADGEFDLVFHPVSN